MAYATVADVESRILRTLTTDEEAQCSVLLDDAAIIIDAFNADASSDAKNIVSCRMVIRCMDAGGDNVPLGASQGSMAGLGYSQSWTMGSGGASGELYLSKLEKQLLGYNNKIGSYSPIQGITGAPL